MQLAEALPTSLSYWSAQMAAIETESTRGKCRYYLRSVRLGRTYCCSISEACDRASSGIPGGEFRKSKLGGHSRDCYWDHTRRVRFRVRDALNVGFLIEFSASTPSTPAVAEATTTALL